METILIIEDEPDICWALERILKNKRFLPQLTFTGNEALAFLKTRGVSLIFLDAKLPDVEGIDLARQIKEIAPDIPVVMISGYFYRDDSAIQDALDHALIRDFISKPFRNEEVLKILEGIFPL